MPALEPLVRYAGAPDLHSLAGGEGVIRLEGWWAASYVVLWALVVLLGITVVALARQIGTLHLRLGPRGALEMDEEGPPLGTGLPEETLVDVDGVERAIGGPGESQLLLFVSPGCMVCEQVLPGIPAVAKSSALQAFVLTDVDEHESRRAYQSKDLGAPLVPARFVAQRYEVPGTPYVIVLDNLGIVRAKGTINNLEQLEGLVDVAQRRATEGAEPH